MALVPKALVLGVLALCLSSAIADSEPRDLAGPVLVADYWPTAHHDIANTGRSFLNYNTTNFNGTCTVEAGHTSVVTETMGFGASSSQDGSTVYVGTSGNRFLAVDPSGNSPPVTRHLPSEDGPGSVLAPPLVVYRDSFVDEVVIVVSTNGFVYHFLPSACDSEVVDSADTSCLLWSTNLEQPIYAAPRLTTENTTLAAVDEGLLLVSTSNNVTNSGGVLYALNMTDGAVVWQHAARAKLGEPLYGLLGEPAVDVGRHGVIYIAYGPYIRALSPVNGAVMATFTGDPSDWFASSVTFSSAASALFVQSQSTSLWRVNVHGTSYTDVSFELQFSCIYNRLDQKCAVLNITDPAVAADEEQWHLSPAPRDAIPPLTDDPLQFLFSTPALNHLEDIVMVLGAQTSSGIVQVDQFTGLDFYWFNGTKDIPFGVSRSSPAVDINGHFTVASDSPDGSGGFTRPLLWNVDNEHKVQYVISMGSDSDLVNTASPALTRDLIGDPIVVFPLGNTLFSITPGLSCPSNNPLTGCSSNGDCDCKSGVCTCNNCYHGLACDQPKNCGNHSRTGCLDGKCECDACWRGDDCNEPKDCGEHSSGCDTQHDICVCDPCWTGDDCRTPLPCGNGVCNNSTGMCECDLCHTGTNCTEPKCEHAYFCDPTDGKCTCNECYQGDNCTEPINCGVNSLGCVKGICQCKPCFHGPLCLSEETCYGHGTCSENVCTCEPCFTGDSCEFNNTCSGHGFCNPVTGICFCEGERTGADCQSCLPCYSGDKCDIECNGHGACLGSGTCACLEGWGGDHCETKCKACFTGDQCTDKVACSDHGTCSAAHGCECDKGYTGAHCETKLPPGHHSNGGQVAGAVIGSLLAVGLIGGLVYYREPIQRYVRRKTQRDNFAFSSTSAATTTPSNYGAL